MRRLVACPSRIPGPAAPCSASAEESWPEPAGCCSRLPEPRGHCLAQPPARMAVQRASPWKPARDSPRLGAVADSSPTGNVSVPMRARSTARQCSQPTLPPLRRSAPTRLHRRPPPMQHRRRVPVRRPPQARTPEKRLRVPELCSSDRFPFREITRIEIWRHEVDLSLKKGQSTDGTGQAGRQSAPQGVTAWKQRSTCPHCASYRWRCSSPQPGMLRTPTRN